MIEKKTWKEFKDTGLLWLVNTILHMFGWAIAVEVERNNFNEEKTVDAYPVRTKFRGFGEEINTKGYMKVTKYLKENIDDLIKEVKNDEN